MIRLFCGIILNLCILMDSAIWFDTIELGGFVAHIKGSQVNFLN